MIDTLTRSRWIRTTTTAGLVPLLLVTSVPACALRSDTPSIPAEERTPQKGGATAAPEWAGATSGAGYRDPVRVGARRSRTGRHPDRGATTRRRSAPG